MNGTRVPAWQRIGLKLKHAKETATPISRSSIVQEPPLKKRRLEKESAAEPEINGGDVTTSTNGSKKPFGLRKQVSFTADTKTTDGDTAVSIIPSEEVSSILEPKSKKSKQAKKSAQPATSKPNNALDYLTEYYRSHSAWKFNKNRETWVLKNTLSTEAIPSSYNVLLAQYIHGLKSQNTRDRLRLHCISAGASSTGGPDTLHPSILSEGKKALDGFPEKTLGEDAEVYTAICDTPRVSLVRWTLDPTGASIQPASAIDDSIQGQRKTPVQPKKRKNRTAVVEYSSSSDSDTDSSSSESDDSSSDSPDNED